MGDDALSNYLLCIPGTGNLGVGILEILSVRLFSDLLTYRPIRADKLQAKNDSAG